jgi:hypothetical protein
MRLMALMKRRGCGRSKVLHQQHLNGGGASWRVDQPAAVLDAGEGHPQGWIAHSLLFTFCAAHPQKRKQKTSFLFSSSSSYRWNAAKDDNLYKTKKAFSSGIYLGPQLNLFLRATLSSSAGRRV